MAKSKYYRIEHFMDVIISLAEKGYSDKEIIETIGIPESSFYNYKKKYPEFSEKLDKAKLKKIVMFEKLLENTMVDRIIAFHKEEINKNTGEIETLRIEQVIPANPGSIQFGLKAIAPDMYDKEKTKKIEHSGSVDTNVILIGIDEIDESETKSVLDTMEFDVEESSDTNE